MVRCFCLNFFFLLQGEGGGGKEGVDFMLTVHNLQCIFFLTTCFNLEMAK